MPHFDVNKKNRDTIFLDCVLSKVLEKVLLKRLWMQEKKRVANSNPSFTVLKVLSYSVSTRRSLRILSSVVPLIGRVYQGTHFFHPYLLLGQERKRRKKTKHEDKAIYFPVDFWRKFKRKSSFNMPMFWNGKRRMLSNTNSTYWECI